MISVLFRSAGNLIPTSTTKSRPMVSYEKIDLSETKPRRLRRPVVNAASCHRQITLISGEHRVHVDLSKVTEEESIFFSGAGFTPAQEYTLPEDCDDLCDLVALKTWLEEGKLDVATNLTFLKSMSKYLNLPKMEEALKAVRGEVIEAALSLTDKTMSVTVEAKNKNSNVEGISVLAVELPFLHQEFASNLHLDEFMERTSGLYTVPGCSERFQSYYDGLDHLHKEEWVGRTWDAIKTHSSYQVDNPFHVLVSLLPIYGWWRGNAKEIYNLVLNDDMGLVISVFLYMYTHRISDFGAIPCRRDKNALYEDPSFFYAAPNEMVGDYFDNAARSRGFSLPYSFLGNNSMDRCILAVFRNFKKAMESRTPVESVHSEEL